MGGAKLNADGRLGIMLTELRLPTIKRLATELCDQSDHEGWPARQLPHKLRRAHAQPPKQTDRFRPGGIAVRIGGFDFGMTMVAFDVLAQPHDASVPSKWLPCHEGAQNFKFSSQIRLEMQNGSCLSAGTMTQPCFAFPFAA